jgi:predicted MFS family arabinose efflux permease
MKSADPSPARVALCGLLLLAVAIGIGRFAFTPILPMMQRDFEVSLRTAGWLASANYIGYLLGALSAITLRAAPVRIVRGSVLAVAALTMAMAATHHPAGWLALRALAGAASAWILIFGSAWALRRLSELGRPQWGGWVFAGVGCGVALSGLLCLFFLQRSFHADQAWIALGATALALGLGAIRLQRDAAVQPAATPVTRSSARDPDHWRLIAAYGCFGFGYIIPATFLPAMGRAQIPDSAVFGWAWPIFGAAALVSTVVAGRLSVSYRRVWGLSQLLMGAGVALPAFIPGMAAILVSALLVGGTFMVATMAGLQEARVAAPHNPAGLMASMTSAFAIGQVIGPMLVGALAHLRYGTNAALLTAAAALVVSAAVLLRSNLRTADSRR